MTTDVISEDLKIRVQGIHLRVPHEEAGAEGMAQNDHRSALFPR
jgi:hypothetical protein